jgi:hypothetical protein
MGPRGGRRPGRPAHPQDGAEHTNSDHSERAERDAQPTQRIERMRCPPGQWRSHDGAERSVESRRTLRFGCVEQISGLDEVGGADPEVVLIDVLFL